jgi:hypothetical protein
MNPYQGLLGGQAGSFLAAASAAPWFQVAPQAQAPIKATAVHAQSTSFSGMMQEAVSANPQSPLQAPCEINETPHVTLDHQLGQPGQIPEGPGVPEADQQREASALDKEKDLKESDATENEAPMLPQQKGKRGRKKAAGEQPAKKRRGGKKSAAKELTEEEQEQLAAGKEVMWKPTWVVCLIQQRIRYDAELNKPKQGVDTWAKIAVAIAAEYPDFDKDAEACRQKLKRVLKQYEGDKQTNERSGSGRANSCPFYEQLDAFFGTKATVNCTVRLSSTSETPANVERVEVLDGAETGSSEKGGSGKTDRKKNAQVEAMKEVMENVVENTTGRVVDALTQASSGTQKVMEGMRSDINNFMGRLLDILERDGL